MALIRCPNCDTLHDLDDAFLASGSRKLRCASCRSVFEADLSESDAFDTLAPSGPQAQADVQPQVLAQDDLGLRAAFAPDEDGAGAQAAAAPQDAPEAFDFEDDFSTLETKGDAEISADDLEALFAEPLLAAAAAPASAPELAAEAEPEPKAFDARALAQSASVVADDELEERRRARRAAKGTGRKAPPPPSRAARGGVIATMMLAAGLGTVASLVMLRQDIVRYFPPAAKVFDMVGLSGGAKGLDILDVQSQMVREDDHETLEVSGRIVNTTSAPMRLPPLRLAIRGNGGSELYVWTANADVVELAPGEASRFARRLASPPPESYSVMVRFVAKDDIVAAVR